MLKKSTTDKQKVVELQELVSQPECLKLLILHTPFTLNLHSLPQCINLVKLDLSRNNLKTFPYLGEMSNLKFMFVHENKLDIDSLIGIFQQGIEKQIKSALSKSIIWVTYWGNKNEFNARHYLANHTSVLAVDHHMVVEEERNETLNVTRNKIKPFDQVTSITAVFNNRKKFNKNATEEEYMMEFWEDIAEIRKKQMIMNPIIKIQKYYRGWIYRIKKVRELQQKEQNKIILKQYLKEWRKKIEFYKKIKAIFKKKNKVYLLYPIKQMRNEIAFMKMKQIYYKVKQKIYNRKLNIIKQYQIYCLLKKNVIILQILYQLLHIKQSKYIMIHLDGVQQFKKYVIPFIKNHNKAQQKQIVLQQNQNVTMRYFYQPIDNNQKEFIRMVKLSQKSVGMIQNIGNIDENSKRFNYSLFKYQGNLKRVYSQRNVHFSGKEFQKMRRIEKDLSMRFQISVSQLQALYGSEQILSDAIRGVYFYNMGYLTKERKVQKKINILSQFSLKRISAILRIQKIWRGSHLRKKLKSVIKDIFSKQRASIIIQRWFRSLAFNHRKIFILNIMKSLTRFNCQSFYIPIEKYLDVVGWWKQKQKQKTKILTFLQMNISVYIKRINRRLQISWNHESEMQPILVNCMVGKKLFPQYLGQKIFQSSDFLNAVKYGEQKSYDKCEISHLFHYGTQISLVNKRGVEFIQVKCQSKYDCRLRVLGLKLLTYKFNHKQMLQILAKQKELSINSELQYRRPIGNEHSIFIYESSSQRIMKVQHGVQNVRIFEYLSKFYINIDQNSKPSKYQTSLKIILVDEENRVESPPSYNVSREERAAAKLNQKFDVSNFLISEVSQIMLNNRIRDQNLYDKSTNFNNYRQSLKRLKVQRKVKIKNRKKFHSMYEQNNDKFIFILDNTQNTKGKIICQSDFEINLKSKQEIERENNLKANIKKQKDGRRLKINSENKEKLKNIDYFTKNFINQGNFIQNQFLYGQIKRIKTEGQKFAFDRVERIRTEQSDKVTNLNKIKQQRIKKIQINHQKHEQQVYKSMIQKKSDIEKLAHKIRKSQEKQHHYKSAPKRMRINFAEECYPIIGKKSNLQNN